MTIRFSVQTGPRRPSVRAGSLIACAAVVLFSPESSRATDYAWSNASGGNWNVSGNWTPAGGPPGAADNATISTAGAYTVSLNDDQSINNVTLNRALATLNHTAGTFTVGGTITLTAGTYRLSGGTISGGSITGGGGRLLLQNNGNNRLQDVAVGAGVLDFSAAAAQLRLQGSTTLAAGTVLGLSGGSNVLAFEQTATVNDLTVNLTASGAVLSVDGDNTLTLGPATTVTHSTAGTGTITSDRYVGGAATLLNQGLIHNTGNGTLVISPDVFTNQAGGIVRTTAGTVTFNSGGLINAAGGTFDVADATLNLSGTNWSNQGTIAVSNSTLNLGGSFTTAGIGTLTRTGGTVNITGSLDNSGATLALTAATGSYWLDGGVITGGSISAVGGSILQLRNNNNNRLNNAAVGLGVLDFSTADARVRLQGTTTLAAGTVLNLSGLETRLAFEQTTTVNDLTVNLISFGANLSVEGNNTLTLGPTTTVTHTVGNSSIASDLFVAGAGAVLNQGLIRNTDTGTLTISPDVFTNLAGGTVRAAAGVITISSGGLINAAGGTLEVNGATLNLSGTNWSNQGTLALSGGTVNLAGSFTTAGSGLGGIARTGGSVNLTGSLDNSGATLALTAATGSIRLTGGNITGGSITAAGGSTLQIQNNDNNRLIDVAVGLGVLDFSTPNARVWLRGTTTMAPGTVIDMSGGAFGGFAGTILAFEQTATVNDLTVNMPVGNANLTAAGGHTLTLGPTTTVTHSSTLTSNINSFAFGIGVVRNQGLIRNTAAGNLIIEPGGGFTNLAGGIVRAAAGTVRIDTAGLINASGGTFDVTGGILDLNGLGWSNQGTLAVSSGFLTLGGSFTTAGINLGGIARTGGIIVIDGSLDNSGATLALTAATGSFWLIDGNITGGSISATGGSTLQVRNSNTNRLINVAVGLNVLDMSAQGARVELEGTTTLVAGTVLTLSGDNAHLALEQTTTLNDLTVHMSRFGTRLSVVGNNTLTLGPTTTVTHSSQGASSIGSDLWASGVGAVVNQGLISNTGVSTLTILAGAFTNHAGGTVRVTDGTLNISIEGNLTNYAGTTLTGGSWEILGGGTLNFGGRTVATLAAGTTVIFDGAAATFAALDALTANNGTLRVLGGKTFTPAAAAVTNAGRIEVGPGSTFAKAIDLQPAGRLEGSGTVTGAVAVGGTVAPGTAAAPVDTLTTGGQTWAGGGVYELSYDQLTGTFVAGTDNDLLTSASGALTVTATPANKFRIRLHYAGTEMLGARPPDATIRIATFGGGVPTSFDTAAFQLEGDVFYAGSVFELTAVGNDVFLRFTPVPEPAALVAAAAGLLGVSVVRRRAAGKRSCPGASARER